MSAIVDPSVWATIISTLVLLLGILISYSRGQGKQDERMKQMEKEINDLAQLKTQMTVVATEMKSNNDTLKKMDMDADLRREMISSLRVEVARLEPRDVRKA